MSCQALDVGKLSVRLRGRSESCLTFRYSPQFVAISTEAIRTETCAGEHTAQDFSECSVDDGTFPVVVQSPCVVPYNFSAEVRFLCNSMSMMHVSDVPVLRVITQAYWIDTLCVNLT
jgi:hypothetical protein